MSKQTVSNLFILSSMPRFYQRLLTGVATHQELGKRLLREIKLAHAFRQVDTVEDLAGLLINIPVKEYQLIAQYYLVWRQCREKNYKTEPLERILEQTKTHKTKALASRGTFEAYKGNTDAALYFYLEALKTSPTISEYIDLSRAIAVMKSQEGFHRSASKDLESLLPIIHHAEPLAHYEFLNSYALELGQVGRKYEARNIISHVIASPFITVYPEWQQTADDMRQASKSFVTVSEMPESKPVTPASKPEKAKPVKPKTKPASVIAFPQLKEAPPPEKPERVTPQELHEMTPDEKRELILAALRSDTIMPGEG